MPDFTSSLYLGMKHSSTELAGWSQLTTGVPAALYETAQCKYVGNYLAGMQSCEKGIVAPSTLHLYLDLFDFLSKQKIVAFVDDKIYPVSRYGIEKLIVKGIPVYTFKHLDAGNLYELITTKVKGFATPVVFTDGFCTQCGKPAPLKEYCSIVAPFKGRIIIDDTQAFGILGKGKDAFIYGYGGGGILQWLNIANANIITVVSLAKAFGVPMAVISGSAKFISALERNSKIRESSSPVSFADLSAVNNVIILNNTCGDYRRRKLLRNILLIKNELMRYGIQLIGGLFPIQSIAGLDYYETIHLFNRLDNNQFKTVLTKNHKDQKPAISFVINCNHSSKEIQALADTIKHLLAHATLA